MGAECNYCLCGVVCLEEVVEGRELELILQPCLLKLHQNYMLLLHILRLNTVQEKQHLMVCSDSWIQ